MFENVRGWNGQKWIGLSWVGTYFLHGNTDSQKSKADQKFIGWVWSEMGVASQVTQL